MDRRKLESGRRRGLVGAVIDSVQQVFFPDNMRFFDEIAAKGEPRAFYNAAVEKGYHDEEDIRGTPLAKYWELFSRGRKLVMEDYSQKYANLARIALRRFSELERGKSIGVSEIRGRLKRLREEGYDVGKYYSMRKDELWEHWMHIKQKIRRCADIYCPGVLAEIDEANRKQIEDARMHL
jgi:hypothetical protein